MGSKPDFLILGEMKCGTTALYQYLIQHPKILSAKQKELHFFYREDYTRKGIKYYRSLFPRCAEGEITGEACVQYFCRAKKVIPRLKESKINPKFILCFRNPIDRAYSHFNHAVVKYPEKHKRSFKEYLDDELRELQANGFTQPGKTTFIWHSLYYRNLIQWLKYYDKGQFLIIDSNELSINSKKICNEVFQFLGLNRVDLKVYPKHHQLKYAVPRTKEVTQLLKNIFDSENQKLYKLIGKNFGW